MTFDECVNNKFDEYTAKKGLIPKIRDLIPQMKSVVEGIKELAPSFRGDLNNNQKNLIQAACNITYALEADITSADLYNAINQMSPRELKLLAGNKFTKQQITDRISKARSQPIEPVKTVEQILNDASIGGIPDIDDTSAVDSTPAVDGTSAKGDSSVDTIDKSKLISQDLLNCEELKDVPDPILTDIKITDYLADALENIVHINQNPDETDKYINFLTEALRAWQIHYGVMPITDIERFNNELTGILPSVKKHLQSVEKDDERNKDGINEIDNPNLANDDQKDPLKDTSPSQIPHEVKKALTELISMVDLDSIEFNRDQARQDLLKLKYHADVLTDDDKKRLNDIKDELTDFSEYFPAFTTPPTTKASEHDDTSTHIETSEPPTDIPTTRASEHDDTSPHIEISEPPTDIPTTRASEHDDTSPHIETSEPPTDIPTTRASEHDDTSPHIETSEPPTDTNPREVFADIYTAIDNAAISPEQAEEAKTYADIVLSNPDDHPREYDALTGVDSERRTKCINSMLSTANRHLGYRVPLGTRKTDDTLDFSSGVASQARNRTSVRTQLIMPDGFGLKRHATMWNVPVITDFGFPFLNFSSEAMLNIIRSKETDDNIKNKQLKKMFKEAAKRYGGVWKAIYSAPLSLIRHIASELGTACTPKYLKVDGHDLMETEPGKQLIVTPIKYYSVEAEYDPTLQIPRDFLTEFYDVIDFSSASRRTYLKYADGLTDEEFAQEIDENNGIPPFYILVPKTAKFSKCPIRPGSLLGSLLNVILGRTKYTMVKTMFQGKRGCLAMESSTADKLFAET